MATLILYEDALCAIWNGNAIPLVDREKQKALLEQLVSKHPVDAAPVVHGEWIRDSGTYGKLICSVCSARAGYKRKETKMGYSIYNIHPSNFCPNCGARMDLKG